MLDADSIRVARPHGEHDPRIRAVAFSRVKPHFRPFALSLSKGRCARQGDLHYERPHYLCFDKLSSNCSKRPWFEGQHLRPHLNTLPRGEEAKRMTYSVSGSYLPRFGPVTGLNLAQHERNALECDCPTQPGCSSSCCSSLLYNPVCVPRPTGPQSYL